MNEKFKSRIIPNTAVETSKDIYEKEYKSCLAQWIIFPNWISVSFYTNNMTFSYEVDEIVYGKSVEGFIEICHKFKGEIRKIMYDKPYKYNFSSHKELNVYAKTLKYETYEIIKFK